MGDVLTELRLDDHQSLRPWPGHGMGGAGGWVVQAGSLSAG